MFPFSDITDEQLKELGWLGVIDSLKEIRDMQRNGLDAYLDQLSDQMADFSTVYGLPKDLLLAMAQTQTEIFQSFMNLGRLEQQIIMTSDLHAFIERTKTEMADTVAQIVAEEA